MHPGLPNTTAAKAGQSNTTPQPFPSALHRHSSHQKGTTPELHFVTPVMLFGQTTPLSEQHKMGLWPSVVHSNILFSISPWLTVLFTAFFYSDQPLNWYAIYFPFRLPYFRLANSKCYLNDILKTEPGAAVRWYGRLLHRSNFPRSRNSAKQINAAFIDESKILHGSLPIT